MTRPAKQPASATSQTSEERFDDLVEEVTQRLEAGESVDPNQFHSFGPELVERLRLLLPTLQAMAALHSGGRSNSRPARTAHLSSTSLAKDLGDFQLGDELGRGGMGIVFTAEQKSLARRVAVKVLPCAGLLSEVALERFRTEARAAASLAHEHIVPVYAVGCERGIHFYAMKLVDGCTLAEVIASKVSSSEFRVPSSNSTDSSSTRNSELVTRNSPDADNTLPVAAGITRAICGNDDWYRSIARLGMQAARALAHAHAQGIVHRDVKPSNLLIDKTGRLWLSDFGLARLEADAGLTRTGDLLGTLRYMSPEQALGQSSELDARADIYSLGATLYECLTLRPAIAAASHSEILRQAADPRIASLRSHDPNIPASLERIILKCLRTTPAERYATAESLAADLARFLQGEKVQARLPTPYQRIRQWAARHPTSLLIAVATLTATSLLLLALVLFYWTADNHSRGPLSANRTDPLVSPGQLPVDSTNSPKPPVMLRSNTRSSLATSQRRRPLVLEPAGARAQMAGIIAISDATATEGDDSFQFIDVFVPQNSGGLTDPRGILIGPHDGYLYVGNGSPNSAGDEGSFVGRYDPKSGAFKDVAFASGDDGVFFDLPHAMTFGPDKKLYLVGRFSENVVRYDPESDTVEQFVPSGSELYMPAGIAFGPDGNLYVTNGKVADDDTSPRRNQVLRFQGPTGKAPGQFIDVFVQPGNGLDRANILNFRGDSLFVSSAESHCILKYNATNGEFQGAFVQPSSGGVIRPSFMIFHTDGYLYVSSHRGDELIRYDGTTGAFVDVVVPAGSAGLDEPSGFVFDEARRVYLGSRNTGEVLRYGPASQAAFTVTLSAPSNEFVTVDYVTTGGSAEAGSDFHAATGTVTFAPGQMSQTILIPTVNDNSVEPNQTFCVALSNPVSGTIVDETGIGTIVDDDTNCDLGHGRAGEIERPLHQLPTRAPPVERKVGIRFF